jgi:hypothetical protein
LKGNNKAGTKMSIIKEVQAKSETVVSNGLVVEINASEPAKGIGYF